LLYIFFFSTLFLYCVYVCMILSLLRMLCAIVCIVGWLIYCFIFLFRHCCDSVCFTVQMLVEIIYCLLIFNAKFVFLLIWLVRRFGRKLSVALLEFGARASWLCRIWMIDLIGACWVGWMHCISGEWDVEERSVVRMGNALILWLFSCLPFAFFVYFFLVLFLPSSAYTAWLLSG